MYKYVPLSAKEVEALTPNDTNKQSPVLKGSLRGKPFMNAGMLNRITTLHNIDFKTNSDIMYAKKTTAPQQ